MKTVEHPPDAGHDTPIKAPNEHGRDLTVGSIPRQLILFSLPVLAGNAIQVAYTIVNRVWVGHFLGPAALAAITVTMQVSFILIAFVNGLTMGASILVSQFAGARNWEGVKRLVQNSIPLTIILSILLLILGEFLTLPLLRAIHTPPEAWPLATVYMRVFLLTFPLIFTAILTTFLLRGVGDSLTPLYFQGSGVLITAILDPLLMLGWLGFPRLGLNGTAIATLIAQSITLTAFFIHLHRKKHLVAPDWRHLHFDWPITKMTLKIGLPASLQQLLVSMGTAVVLIYINEYKENATAGYGAASQMDMVAFFLAMSISMAISMVTGQNIGAGHYDRVKQVFGWGLLLSGGMVLVVSATTVLMPTTLMRMFIDPVKNPETFEIGVNYLRIVGPNYICFAVMFVCIGIINGAGHTLVSTFTTLIGLWLVRIPLAGFLSHHLHRVEGIWYASVLSFWVATALGLSYYFSGRWKRAVLKPTLPISVND